ncbi:MAG: ThuA domain-containing protein [Planctomycetes bacterium]|nr:ThuA domain-containing protein [Planctomycetota bacterium]
MTFSIKYFASAAVVLALLAGVTSADEKGKTKILLIGKQPDHPWGTHMYLHTCRMLTKCLHQTDGVETVVSDGWPKDAAKLKGVKTIVVYTTPAAELLLDGPHRDEVDRLMKQGVGLVTIHWASSVQKKNLDRLGERWLSYMGGTWVSNVGLSTGKSPLKQLIAKHPICRGWSEYELHDEFYLNPTIAKAKPLLQVTTKGQNVVVGWVHERKDGGRAFGTTLGHYYRNFQIEAFRRMIVNGILWTAHVDVPKGGAPVTLSKKQLALPPKPKK